MKWCAALFAVLGLAYGQSIPPMVQLVSITPGGGGGGGGTVTSFSAGTLSPLFTTSVATPTATPALSFSLSNAAAGTIFGNTSGSSGAPSYIAAGSFADLVLGLSSTGFVKRTGANSYSIDSGSYQPIATNLTSIGALANAAGWLKNDGSGVFVYSTPTKTDVGLGSVTNDAQTKAAVVPNTAPAAGQVLVGNAGGTAYAPQTVSGALSLTSAGVAAITASATLPDGVTAATQSQGANSTKVATTAYVDAALADFEIKDPVVAATTAALPFSPTYSNGSSGVGATLTGGVGILAFDGYTPALGDRVLIKNQASTFQNGVYTVTTVGTIGVGYVLTRATDFNQTANIIYGDSVAVLQGTTNANQQFTMNNQNAITVGTTAITFAQTSGGSQLAAGTGISITGNTVAVDTTVTATASNTLTFTNKSLSVSQVTGLGSGVSVWLQAATAVAGSRVFSDGTNPVWNTPGSSFFWEEEFMGSQPVGSSATPVLWFKGSITSGSFTWKNVGWPHPGVLRLTSGASQGNGEVAQASDSGSPGFYAFDSLSGQANWDATFIFKLGPVELTTTNVRTRIGFTNGAISTFPSTNFIGLRYDTNVSFGDTTWVYTTVSGGTASTSTTNVAALDNNWHRLRIRSTVAGTILFSMDGGAETSIATNVPNVSVAPGFTVVTDTSSAKTLDVDYFSFYASGLNR